MKWHRLLILGIAAWAGSWIYKLQYTSHESETTPGSGGRSIYTDVTGPGSLGRTVRTSASMRTTPGTNPPGELNSYANSGPDKSMAIGDSSHKRGASPAVEDMAPGDPALIQAAAKGDKNLVESRINLHVKIDSRDELRRTPLMYAAWNGYDDISNRLISAGANPELQDRQGNNAFDYAASRGLTDSLHFMLSRTHTTDDKHYVEYATIMQAVYAGDPARLPEGNGKLAAVNHINPEGQAPLHIASGNGSVALMDALIRRGAQVDITNDNRQTPLHWAAWNNRPQAVQLLLNNGANVAATDYAGNTPLILAAQNGGTDSVQVLLAKGADRYAANKSGKTAAIVAEDGGFQALAAMLK